MSEVAFVVHGVAQSKGSARAFVPKGWTRPIITTTNRGLKDWEHLVRDGASRAMISRKGALLEGALLAALWFRLPRPKSLGKHITHHTKRPDLDKLTRAALDAMTGVVYHDDGQVVRIESTKQYADIGQSPRLSIRVIQQE